MCQLFEFSRDANFERLASLLYFLYIYLNFDMPSLKLNTPIEIDHFYHIYNRGNNHELLFYKDYNYAYFLKKYEKYLSEHVSTFAYCLMPNHFHLLIKTKTELVSNQLKKLFQSYALSINKQENRTGSLFTKPFRRILIEDNEYLKYLVFYIHYNPEKHKFFKDFRDYRHSSYQNLIRKKETDLNREELFDWFGGREEFLNFHNYYHEEKRLEKYIIE